MKKLNTITTLVGIILGAFSTLALTNFADTGWVIDKAHSAVNFKVTHFFTPVNGQFNDYDATIHFDPEHLDESKIEVAIMVNSVDTKNAKRDGHLKTGDFFHAEKYPVITFKSTKIEAIGNDKFVAHGRLTIKDITKKVELPFTLLGMKDHPMKENSLIAGITASTKIDRTDFTVGTGDFASDAVIGDEVTINLNLEMHAAK
jgi:polyisoprenoid-binding protein YceI